MTVSAFNPKATPALTAAEQAACAQLKIQLGSRSPEFTTALLLHPTSDVLHAALLLHRQAEPKLDDKAAGAYLVNRLAWDLSAVLAWLDLNHYDLSVLTPEALGVHAVIEREWHKGEWHRYVVYQFALSDLHAASEVSAETVARCAFRLFEQLIPALAAQVRLSANALWRLVTDGLSAAYLYVGKEQQEPDRAMARVRAVVEAAGKPLANKQWQFNYYSVAAEDSPTQKPLGNWFRARGGCCRYYTLEEGKDYCTSCVHVSEDERSTRLKRYLCNHALEE